eukprot:COSAG04_NODE_2322_length_4333_cov_7.621871_10_plen_103_part_00
MLWLPCLPTKPPQLAGARISGAEFLTARGSGVLSAGFDLVMVYAGAEHIHAEVYLEMGVTEEELGAFHGLGRGSTAAERESQPHSVTPWRVGLRAVAGPTVL